MPWPRSGSGSRRTTTRPLASPIRRPRRRSRRAYRKLAKEHHPDANPGAEDRFKEISAAYDVLGDADKRKEYDEVRRLGPVGGFGGGGGGVARFSVRRSVSTTWVTCSAASSTASGRGRGGAAPDRAARCRPRGRAAPRRSSTPSTASPPPSTSPAMPRATPATAPAPRRARRRVICPALRRPRRHRRQPGSLLLQQPVPRVRRPRHASSSRRARPVGAPASSAGARQVKVRIPAGVDDGQRIRLKGRGGAGRNGGRPATSSSSSTSAATSCSAARGKRPHHHRAGHVRRGRAGRRR